MSRNIAVYKFSQENVVDVATLHLRVLGWSTTGRLGKSFIVELYQAVLGTEGFFGFVAYDDHKQLLGFMTATTRFMEVRRAITPLYKKRAIRILVNCLSRPGDLIAIAESRFIVPRIYCQHGLDAEALSIVTDITRKSVQPAIAYLLIKKVKDEMRHRGISKFGTQVLAQNHFIEAPYFEAHGGKIIASSRAYKLYSFEVSTTSEPVGDKRPAARPDGRDCFGCAGPSPNERDDAQSA